MVLIGEICQLEVITLENHLNKGFGFGLTGNRSSGAIVKYITPGSLADRDSRLKCGDHILQIGGRSLRGLGCEKVALLIKQSGDCLKMIVARPVNLDASNELTTIPASSSSSSSSVIIPTKLLSDPDEFDKLLNDLLMASNNQVTKEAIAETEQYTITLRKNEIGFGLTVAGYVCEESSGVVQAIFVKKIAKNSAADLCARISINDRIVKVNEIVLNDLTNFEAIQLIKSAGSELDLTFERYLPERIVDANGELSLFESRSPLSSCSNLSWFTIDFDSNFDYFDENRPTDDEDFDAQKSLRSSISSSTSSLTYRKSEDDDLKENFMEIFIDPKMPTSCLDRLNEMNQKIRENWIHLTMATNSENCHRHGQLIVLHLWKISSLGISLEGTVEVDNGREINAKHFIRAILPNGLIGQNAKLMVGDELLEANGKRLRDRVHSEVVQIFKELPKLVHLVCYRARLTKSGCNSFNSSINYKSFETRNILANSCLGSIRMAQKPLPKSTSELSVNTISTINEIFGPKSKSLTTIDYLAQWDDDEIQIAELEKSPNCGLDFSVLDYQDPIDFRKTVIVLRALIRGSAAEQSNRLRPGDKLVFVNDFSLLNVSLSFAVRIFKNLPPGRVRIGFSRPLLE